MFSQRSRALGRLSRITAVALSAAFTLAPAARANLTAVTTCPTPAATQPFTQWADLASYELAPGGDFEKPGWTLNGSAQRVRGSEPYAATGTLGNWSLSLPAGSSAQSPPTCLDATYPTVRFFIVGSGSVAVSIVDGNLEIPAGIAYAGPSWQPTLVMLTNSALLATTSNGCVQVSLKLTAQSGNPQVDDAFIDPWFRR